MGAAVRQAATPAASLWGHHSRRCRRAPPQSQTQPCCAPCPASVVWPGQSEGAGVRRVGCPGLQPGQQLRPMGCDPDWPAVRPTIQRPHTLMWLRVWSAISNPASYIFLTSEHTTAGETATRHGWGGRSDACARPRCTAHWGLHHALSPTAAAAPSPAPVQPSGSFSVNIVAVTAQPLALSRPLVTAVTALRACSTVRGRGAMALGARQQTRRGVAARQEWRAGMAGSRWRQRTSSSTPSSCVNSTNMGVSSRVRLPGADVDGGTAAGRRQAGGGGGLGAGQAGPGGAAAAAAPRDSHLRTGRPLPGAPGRTAIALPALFLLYRLWARWYNGGMSGHLLPSLPRSSSCRRHAQPRTRGSCSRGARRPHASAPMRHRPSPLQCGGRLEHAGTGGRVAIGQETRG